MKRVQTTLNSFFQEKKKSNTWTQNSFTCSDYWLSVYEIQKLESNHSEPSRAFFFKLPKPKELNKCPVRETTKLAFFEEENFLK